MNPADLNRPVFCGQQVPLTFTQYGAGKKKNQNCLHKDIPRPRGMEVWGLKTAVPWSLVF